MRDRLDGDSVLKRILAREWLYFVSAIIIGFVLIPFLLSALFGPPGLGGFYEELVSDHSWGLWLFGLAPYLLFQLVRSIMWAIKTVRS
jgi:hypothetical protein